MSTMFPRLSITLNAGEGTNIQGKLSALSIGFGIHQAWIYLAMFGMASGAPLLTERSGHTTSSVSSAFIVSIVLYCCTLLFAAVTDQKFLRFYTAKRVIVGACLTVTLGTLALLFMHAPFPFGSTAMVCGGVATGVGSALLVLYWGTAFSRHGGITIIMNSIVSIMVALLVYSCVQHVVPWPYSGILAALLPLAELPFLWQLTPVSYAVRHAVPIFDPLPVRKLPFSFRIALPAFLFGLIIGIMRLVATVAVVPTLSPDVLLLPVCAGGAIASLLLVTPFCFSAESHWDGLFRPTVIFISVTLLFLSVLPDSSFRFETMALLVGYMCFEVLMWVFLGEMAQVFRISPIFLFGLGQGSLALGSMASSLAFPDLAALDLSAVLAGTVDGAAVLMLVMIAAYATMPHVRDIKQVAILCPQFKKSKSIAAINRQAAAEARKGKGGEAESVSLIEEGANVPLFDDATAQGAQEPEDGELVCAAVAASKTNEPESSGLPGASGGPDARNIVHAAYPRNATDVSRTPPPPGISARAGGAYTMHGSEVVERRKASSSSSSAQGSLQTPESETDLARKSGRFRKQCEAIANRYLLSRRETEVMFLLAKGYNAALIQEKLYISKSTAKTHIDHIYRKLNIHTQQELIRMAEGTDEI